MYILGLDLETSGLDPANDKIIEIGYVLWDLENHKPILMASDLVLHEGLEVSPLIQKITGIQPIDLQNFGIPIEEALKKFKQACAKASFIVAHNGNDFDKKFLEKEWAMWSQFKVDLDWIDTSTDLPYGDDITTRKLTHLAAEHGFLNPFSHRALFDVLTMLKVFSHYDFNEVLELARSKTLKIIAKVSYDNREQAKKMGFRWDGETKSWYKKIKEVHLEKENFPFEIGIES